VAWHNHQKTVIPYVVRIETPLGSGTGFLFAYNEDKSVAAIATAAHVVDHAHDWKEPLRLAHIASGKDIFLTDKERVIFLDRKRDSASILVSGSALEFPQTLITLMNPDRILMVGVEVAWTGFPSVAYPQLCFFRGAISAYLPGDACYLIDGVAINGVSGGPIFGEAVDDKGTTLKIIGNVSAYLPNRIGGSALPGLLRAQDLSAFQDTIKTIKSLDDGKRKEREAAKQAEPTPAATTPRPEAKQAEPIPPLTTPPPGAQ
jgi:hypothetical protein